MALWIASRVHFIGGRAAVVELSFEEAMTPEVIEKYNATTTGGSIY
jgi:hypothetical protein